MGRLTTRILCADENGSEIAGLGNTTNFIAIPKFAWWDMS